MSDKEIFSSGILKYPFSSIIHFLYELKDVNGLAISCKNLITVKDDIVLFVISYFINLPLIYLGQYDLKELH